jgi:hypothetical protein
MYLDVIAPYLINESKPVMPDLSKKKHVFVYVTMWMPTARRQVGLPNSFVTNYTKALFSLGKFWFWLL